MKTFRFVDGITAHSHGECKAPTIIDAYEELFGKPQPCAAKDFVGKYVMEFGCADRFNECGGTHVYIGNRYLRTIHYVYTRRCEDEKTQTPKPGG